jgi:hypothetical protein
VTPADDDIKDFTSAAKKVRFKINDDIFEGLADIPALLLVEFAAATEKLSMSNASEQPQIFRTLFQLVLNESSAARFIERMSDPQKPISVDQINNIMPWLMEQYGLRPTTPSEDSSDGSVPPDAGKNSTERAPLVALTSVPLAANASST